MPIKYTRLTIKHARNQIIYHFPFADTNQWSILFFEKINHVLIYFNIYCALFIEDIKDINYIHRGNKGNNENQWSSCSILIFFTLRWLQSRLQASTFICFIYYVSIMVHISFTMVHFPLPIINHICHAALIDTCLNYYPYFIDTCHMHQGFQKSVGWNQELD